MSAQPAPHPAGRFATAIRRARLVAGLSQSEVAAGVGVAPSVVSQWERGWAIPTVPTFTGLVAVCGPWPLLQALLSADQLASQLHAAQPQEAAQSSTSRMPHGHCIRAARQAAGLTQTQLGTRVGVRQSSVGQWEGGRTLPTLPMLRRLVAVLGPWPLLAPLLRPPAQREQGAGTEDFLVAPPASRNGRQAPPREELARLIVQEGRDDQDLAAHYQQPIGVIRRWRCGYRLDRATPPPRRLGRPPRLARPAREELARLAIHQGRSDQELAARYGCSPATIKSWRNRYGLVRPQRRIDRAQVLTLLRQGLPVYQIAEQVGCTTRHIYKLAKAAGTPVTTGARPRAPRRDRADRERVLAMWRQGVPVEQIAEAVGRKPATIYKIAQAAGAYVITGQRPPPTSSPSSRRAPLTDDHIATSPVACSVRDPGLKTTDQRGFVPMQPQHHQLAARGLQPLLPPQQQILLGAFPVPGRGDHADSNRQEDQLVSVHDLTTAEVARLFGVSEQAVRQWASHDKLPWAWVRGRRRYPVAAVAKLAQQHNIPLPPWLYTATATHQGSV